MQNKVKDTIKENRFDFIKLIIFGIIIVAFVAITIELLPWIISLKDASGREAFQKYINDQGVYGVFILLGAQILQVIVAFIPGEPIEVLGGLLYGAWGGYFICTLGMLIGTVIIYYMVKYLGMSFINKLAGGESKLEKFKFLNDTKKLETILFLLFFIPGTPKDLLTYFVPLTRVKPLTFFLIVTVARIPSILSSTYAGASIGEGEWLKTVIIFAVIGILSLLGILFNDKIIKMANKTRENIRRKRKK